MEPASFAIGALGLSGAFTACVDILIKAKKFRNFKDDSRILNVRFDRARHQFEQWGEQVGIAQLGGDFISDEKLFNDFKKEDAEIRSLIKEHLSIIQELFPPEGKASPYSGLNESQKRTHSKRQRFSWALGGKEIRNEHVTAFEQLVQNLYELAPPDSSRNRAAADAATLSNVEVLHDMITEMAEKATANRRKELFRWLEKSPLNEEQFDNCLRTQVKGTCEWIYDKGIFVNWDSDSPPSNTLWINGPGGFGKTVLCASLVKQLSLVADSLVVKYFFSSDPKSRDDPTLALRSWIAQMVELDQSASNIVYDYYEKDTDPTASRKTIRALFTAILGISTPSIYVLDGIDECSLHQDRERQSAIDLLQFVVGGLAKTENKLLLVSRDLIEIRQVLESAKSGFAEHIVTKEDVESDTAALSESLVEQKLGKRKPAERALISAILREKSQGQFLWIHLQESKLRSTRTTTALRDSLKDTPEKLSDIYQVDWNRILASDSRDWAISLLQWAACATRPLTVAETIAAIMIDKPLEELSEYRDIVDKEFVNEEIKAVCGSLLDVHQNNNEGSALTTRLWIPHFTVREFLFKHLPCPAALLGKDGPVMNIVQWQHAFCTRSCLQYLNNPHLWKTEDPEEPLLWFRNYASDNWPIHAFWGWRESFTELVVDLIMNEHTAGWRKRTEKRIAARNKEKDSLGWAPLSHAVEIGIPGVALALIQQRNCQVNQPSPNRLMDLPLNQACHRGSELFVRILLDNGADVSARSSLNKSQAIHWASIRGGGLMVQLLLSHGADANAESLDQRTPLMLASGSGNFSTAQVLLDNGAEVSFKGYSGVTPLMDAARGGHVKIVELLLRSGAEVNETAEHGATALYLACLQDQSEVVRTLLEHGADLNLACNVAPEYSPLTVASILGFASIVNVLLENHAEVEHRSSEGMTPLCGASQVGHRDIVKLLLAQNAQVDASDHDGSTPLVKASSEGHLEIAKHLLNAGANANPEHVKVSTPLQSAVLGGHTAVAALLCREGAAIDEVDIIGDSALSMASWRGNIDLIHLLLSNGARVNITNEQGRSPLYGAISACNSSAVKVLIDAGADVCHIDHAGEFPLYHAAEMGGLEIFNILLQSGASQHYNHGRNDGRRPLAAASRKGHLAIVQRLIGLGATLDHFDDSGFWSALHLASRADHVNVAQALLDSGAVADLVDRKLWTPLHDAANRNKLDIVKLLLRRSDMNPNLQTGSGYTPLHLATLKNHPSVVETLLQCERVEVETQNILHNTPLLTACKEGNVEIVKLFLVHSKIRCDHRNYRGSDPLIYAAANGHVAVLEALLEDGRADPGAHMYGKGKLIPLIKAVGEGHLEVVRTILHDSKANRRLHENLTRATLCGLRVNLLRVKPQPSILSSLLEDGIPDPNCILDSGISLPSRLAAHGDASDLQNLLKNPLVDLANDNKGGGTALMVAALKGNDATLSLLLANPQVDPSERNITNHTALHLAARYGHESTVKLLLDDGRFDAGAQSWQKLTPLFSAVANGHESVVRILLPYFQTLTDQCCLGHDLIWWAHRSGNKEVVKALCRLIVTESLTCDVENLPTTVQFDEDVAWCYSCTLTTSEFYVNFKAMRCGGLVLCAECYSRAPEWPGIDLQEFFWDFA